MTRHDYLKLKLLEVAKWLAERDEVRTAAIRYDLVEWCFKMLEQLG